MKNYQNVVISVLTGKMNDRDEKTLDSEIFTSRNIPNLYQNATVEISPGRRIASHQL